MARVDMGENLSSPQIQPGWKMTDDGYGLRTINVTYKVDQTAGFDFIRGEAFPIADYAYCKLHKQTASFDNLGIMSQNCDYVGVAPDVNGGVYTNPQITSANGLTSENIAANPNFFVSGGAGYGSVIAGTTFTSSDKGPVVSYMDGTTKKSRKSFVGSNGACFENPDGGRFIGFVDPTYKHFFGKTNYLSPTTSFSGHFYTTDSTDVQAALGYLGTTSYDNDWAGTLPKIVPTYFGTAFHAGSGTTSYDQLLLSQVNVEDFGSLYKVSYEVRYSREGWADEVYRKASLI